jgi:RNA polymerase sigma-70 factor (ECF subfamily)
MNAGELTLPIRDAASSQPDFEELLAAHQQRVLRTAYRLLGRREDAQDAAQEVFLRLLRHLGEIDGDPAAWLYRVTVNVCNDHYRRRPMLAEPVDLPDPSPHVDRTIEMDQRKALLIAGLKRLTEREREVTVLRHIEGLPTRQVAAILGVEEVTVRTHAAAARMKLTKFVRSRA